MQAGNLVGGDVLQFTTRILVNGEQRYGAWTVDRELSGDLLAQVVAVSGVTQATGSVTWATEKDVESRPLNPWNPSGWLPRRGDRIEIFVSDSVTEWKQFVGVIDKTTGDLEGGFQSTIIDDFDKLSASVSHQALLRIMPPIGGNGGEYRGIGLMAFYHVDFALRAAGFNCTPTAEYGSSLTAHGQGSIWPVRGTLSSVTAGASHASTHPAPWGIALGGFEADYTLWGVGSSSGSSQVTVCVAPDHTEYGYIRLFFGAGYVQLNISATRVATARVAGVEVPGSSLALGSATVVSLLAKGGVVTIRTNLGTQVSVPMSVPSGTSSTVKVYASPGSRMAGFQVSFPTRSVDELRSTYHVPNAKIDTTSLILNGLIDASPTIEDRTAQSVLSEIGEATLSAMWIDETGVMQWVPSNTLRGRSSVRTVTTLDDVLSLDWEDGLLGTASKVTVTGRRPGITRGRWRTVVLARGGGSESIKSGDELEIFLEPQQDEDWIQPSTEFIEVGGSAGVWGTANNPEYSLTGLYYSANGGETELSGLGVTITTAELGLQKILVKYIAGSWASNVEGVLSTSPMAGTLWPKNRDKALPKLVGSGRVSWTDQQVTAIGAGGPGPELVHDAGPWSCRSDSTTLIERFADYIQSQTATPLPVISGLGIVPDPRLQLGDVITVESELMGVTLDVLIVSVSTGHSVSGLSMELGVRVIDTTRTSMTYAQFQQSLPGSSMTYAQLNALVPTPQTYSQFDKDL